MDMLLLHAEIRLSYMAVKLHPTKKKRPSANECFITMSKKHLVSPRFDRELTRLLNPESDPDFDGDLDIDAYSDIYSETSAADDRNEPKPAPVCRHACCLAEDGHSMYVSGGQCDVEEVSSQLFRYDFETEMDCPP